MPSGSIGTAYVDVAFDDRQVKRQVGDLGNKIERDLGTSVKQGSQHFDDLGTSGARNLGAIEKQTTKTSTAFAGMGKQLKFAVGAFGVGLGAEAAVRGIETVLGAASDLTEEINKTAVVFGDSGDDVVAWSKTLADSFGISQRAALEAAGTFGNMLVPMGFARGEAAQMSKRMVELAGDMASFNNASPAETLDALRAGLAGETEPLRRYGVFLNEGRIQTEAFNLGLTKHADAQRAAADAVKGATSAVTEATRERTAAAKAVDAATKAVATAEAAVQSATDKTAGAQERVRDSTERLADARQASRDATQKVRDAEAALGEVQRKAKSLQDALTDARKRATQQLLDLREAASDAALTEEGASIALERARLKLIAVNADSEASDLDKREAALAVAQAEDGLSDSQRDRAQTTTELNAAQRKGVKGAQDVLDAQEAIRKNNLDQEKAARAVEAAQRRQADSLDAVADAQRGVVKAQDDLRKSQNEGRAATAKLAAAHADLADATTASDKAARNLTKAQGDLNDAQELSTKLGTAATKQLTAQQKAQATYALIMRDTADQHGDASKTIGEVAGQMRVMAANTEDAEAALGQKLLPTQKLVIGAFNDLFDLDFGKLARGVGDLGDTGETFAEVGRDITGIVRELAPLFDDLYAILRDLDPVWRLLGEVALASVRLIANEVASLVQIIGGVVQIIRSILEGDWSGAWEGAKQVVSGLTNLVKGELEFMVALLRAQIALVTAPARAIGNAIVNGVTGIVDGIGDAVKDSIRAALVFGEDFLGGVGSRAKAIGLRVVSAAVDGVAAIGNEIRDKVRGVVTFGDEILGTLDERALAIGRAIVAAAVRAVGAIGGEVRDRIRGALAFGQAFLDDVVDAAKSIGKALTEGVVKGMAGIGREIWDRFKEGLDYVWSKIKSLSGPLGKAADFVLGRSVPPPAEVAGPPAAPGATAQAAGPIGGTLYGTTRPGAGLERTIAAALAARAPAAPAPVLVRVYIGDEELRGLVRTEVGYVDDATARALLAGLR